MEKPTFATDRVADNPGLMAYPHHVGSIAIKPEDVGKQKSRALAAMYEQTDRQLQQIQKQVELMLAQANEIQNRIRISEKIYTAKISFEPFVGHIYHLYKKGAEHVILLIGPHEWGRSATHELEFVNTVRLLSDHTWEIVNPDYANSY